MLVSQVFFAFSAFSSVATGLALLNSNFQIRNAAGTASSDTLYALRRSLSSAVTKRDKVFKNSTSLNTSWDGVTLFSIEGETEGNPSLTSSVEIVCTTCYIKGTATVQFTVNGNFNASQAFHNVTSSVEPEVSNITTATVHYVENYVDNVTTSVFTDGFQLDDLDFPPLDIDFDVAVPEIPACDLMFQFDGMELYMQIDTTLASGATYTLNLYSSDSPIGFAVASELLIGVVFSVDLILSVESEIDISTGFHIQLHDGVTINIPMFEQNVSSIAFNGGNFEFLPVTIQSSGAVLTALLRIGIRAGLDISTPSDTIAGVPLDVSAGLVGAVFVDVAHFTTNVTEGPAGSEDNCALQVVEEYSLLLGANSGATVAIAAHTWGPTPNTQIPLFFTTLAAACAATKTASAAVTSATIAARKENTVSLTTTTTEITETYTATICLSTGQLNCPVSLQSTSRNTVTKTLVSVVPSGSKATFATTAKNTAVSTIAFGTGIHAMSSTTGSPVSFVPQTTSSGKPGSTGMASILNGKTGGLSNKIIIGVSVGVGVPVLIALIAGLFFCIKRKRASRNTSTIHASPFPEPFTPVSYQKKSPVVTVVEGQWGRS